MRTLVIATFLALLASPAFPARKEADACAAGLTVDSQAVYRATVEKMRPGADNEAVVRKITLGMVGSGRLNVLTARDAAEAAGNCLRKLSD